MTPTTARVPALLGPTGSGKSAIALRLAEEFGAEIVSCDSRQIYRGMDIGTAKPSAAEQARVRHWLIDIIEPTERYCAFRFREDALSILAERLAAGRRLLLCGGTGLYFKCLSEGMVSQRPADPALRERLRQQIAQQGVDSIFETLKAVDPVAAARIHPKDTTRVIRALEVYHTTGIPLSESRKDAGPPAGVEFRAVTVHLPRAELYDRINRRVERMAAEGLWDEFLRLRLRGFAADSPGLQCLGYRELLAVENGSQRMEEALDRIRQATRRFAKRQMTWFRHQMQAPHTTADARDYETIRTLIASWAGWS